MGTTADKLQYLVDAKSAISAAIISKGGTVPTELSGYGPAIEALPSGGDTSISSFTVPRGLSQAKIDNKSCPWLSSIVEFNIPDTLSAAGAFNFAYTQTPALTAINVDLQNMSAWCGNLINQSLPQMTQAAGNGNLGRYLYMNGTEVTDYVIPDGVTTITQKAFWKCFGLRSISVAPNTTVGNNGFDSCKNATSIVYRGDVTLGNYTMWYCTNLQSVTFKGNVNSIGTYCFTNDTSLTDVTFETMTQAQVQALANYPFAARSGCVFHCTDGDITIGS